MAQIEKPVRVGDLAQHLARTYPDVEPGTVYVDRSRISDRFDGIVDLLHVMSTYRGGQIRGYLRREGASEWTLRQPAYEGDWPEMDQAVANLIGERVVGLSGIACTPKAVT